MVTNMYDYAMLHTMPTKVGSCQKVLKKLPPAATFTTCAEELCRVARIERGYAAQGRKAGETQLPLRGGPWQFTCH
eukprot:6186440-Pleurochrysis_carterae.AAC.2